MANDTTTSSGLAAEIKQFYDSVLLERALPNLVHAQWAQRRPIPRNAGRSIEFRRFNSLPEATTPLTEGTPSNQVNVSVSNVTASLAQYGSYVAFTDLVEETTIDPYLTETAQVLGEQAGSTIDLVIRNVITSAPNVRFVGGVGSRGAVTASSILSASEIRRAGRTLKRANARGIPELGGKFAFALHPDGIDCVPPVGNGWCKRTPGQRERLNAQAHGNPTQAGASRAAATKQAESLLSAA